MGKVRRLAVNDVLVRKISKADVARKYGVHRSTIGKWLAKAPKDKKIYIDTKSCRPHHHPHELSQRLIDRVIRLRKEVNRCAPILHRMLLNEGIDISLSSVERILRRYDLTRKKKQLKPLYAKIERPVVNNPGDLVEVDTIHFVKQDYTRFYIYAAIDVCSRMGYAQYSPFISAHTSFSVIQNAISSFSFAVTLIQTDNGSEFSEDLYLKLQNTGISLRHTRVGRSNDNAHIERFNRTIQEECFHSQFPHEHRIQKRIDHFITYYNSSRLHLALNCQTPASFVAKLKK